MHTVQKIPVMTFYPHVYALFSFIYLIFVVLTSSRRQLLLVCVKEVLEMYDGRSMQCGVFVTLISRCLT